MLKMQKKVLLSILIAYKFIFVLGAHGAFKARFIRAGKCNVTTKPWDKNPSFVFNAELYNTSTGETLLRGNITVSREETFKKVHVTSYIWENNAWKVIREMKKSGCSRLFFPLMEATMSVKFNPKTCAIYKGTYVFSDFDNNKAVHLWKNTSKYGVQLWIFEIFSNATTIACQEFESRVEPVAESA